MLDRMKNILKLFILLSLTVAGNAEQRKLTKIDFALLAAETSARTVDVYSTHYMLERGNRELFLPKFIANNNSTMSLYSYGIVASDYFLLKYLTKHKTLARVIVSVSASQDMFWAIHNFTLPDRRQHAKPSTQIGSWTPR